MARIDWVLACDLAFFDRQDRLCLVGITNRLPVPRLPLAIDQLMLVARLVDLRSVEEFEVSVAVLGPSGRWTTPTNGHGVAIEMSGEYVLITLREIPLVEEGVYGFHISLSGQEPAAIDIPVLAVGAARHAEVH
jgi:hypothetical protein